MNSRPQDRLTIAWSAAFLLLYPASALMGPGALWGVDALLHAAWAPVAFPVGILIILAAIGRPLHVKRAWESIQAHSIWVYPTLVIVLSLVLPPAVHLLGDGYLLIRELDAEAWERLSRTDRAPLSFWLLVRLHRAILYVGGDAELTYRLVSTASGILYGILISPVARAISPTESSTGIVSGVLLTAGYLPLFLGYVENYAPLYPGMMCLVWLLARSVREGRDLVAAGILLGVLVTLHFTTASLIPGLLFAAWATRSRGWVRVSAEVAICPVVMLALLHGIGFDFLEYTATLRSHTLPLTAEHGGLSAYSLLSAPHLLDVLNSVLLAYPIVLIVVLSGAVPSRLGDPLLRLLLTLSAGPTLFVLVANPEIGAFRDWDILSLPGLPLILLTALAWARHTPSQREATCAVGAAALHALLWCGMLADETAARNRFAALMENTPLSSHGRVYGWETLGTFFRDGGDHANAAEAYQDALEANPNHARLWLLLGNARLQEGRLKDARAAYRRSLALSPESSEAASNLGVVLVRLGEYHVAIEHLDRAVRLRPDYAEAWMNRGVAKANAGQLDEAITSIREAVRLDNDYVNAHRNLATLYARKGMQDSARHYQQKALDKGKEEKKRRSG